VAIAPHYWQQARRDAPIHLQMEMRVRPGRDGSTALGPVVRIFRDDTGRLRVGGEIAFRVSCFDPDEPRQPAGPPILGGQRFHVPIGWLKAARYLEVYLYESGSGYEVYWDQVTPLKRTTRTPMNPVESRDYGVLSPDEVRYPDTRWERLRNWWQG
jgi:hypothetical protein